MPLKVKRKKAKGNYQCRGLSYDGTQLKPNTEWLESPESDQEQALLWWAEKVWKAENPYRTIFVEVKPPGCKSGIAYRINPRLIPDFVMEELS